MEASQVLQHHPLRKIDVAVSTEGLVQPQVGSHRTDDLMHPEILGRAEPWPIHLMLLPQHVLAMVQQPLLLHHQPLEELLLFPKLFLPFCFLPLLFGLPPLQFEFIFSWFGLLLDNHLALALLLWRLMLLLVIRLLHLYWGIQPWLLLDLYLVIPLDCKLKLLLWRLLLDLHMVISLDCTR